MDETTGSDLHMMIFAFTASGGAALLLSADADNGTLRRVGIADSLAKESRGSDRPLARLEPITVVVV